MPPPRDAAPSLALDRGLTILELLASEPSGLPLLEIAQRLGFPASATHRLLANLVDRCYLMQAGERGSYTLSTRLFSLAALHMAGSGIVDAAKPILDKLADETGELARLSVAEGDGLTWVARAQGARGGLIYDPEMGQPARLSCSATGFAWLSAMSDADALAAVDRQSYGSRAEFGPKAPRSAEELLAHLNRARRAGYAVAVRTYYDWMAAVAVVVRHPVRQDPIGTVSIAGPAFRLPKARLHDVAPMVISAAAALSNALVAYPALARSSASRRAPFFRLDV